MSATKIVHIVFNENRLTHAAEKDAVYVNEMLVAEGSPLSAAELSFHLMAHPGFTFTKLFIQQKPENFPTFLFDIESKNIKKENDLFEQNDAVIFTTYKNGVIIYAKGDIQQITEKGFSIKERTTGEIFSLSQDKKEDTLYCFALPFNAQNNKLLPVSETACLNRIKDKQRLLISPQTGQEVSFKTNNKTGKGIVKSVRYSSNYNEISFFVTIKTEKGDIEVAANHIRYPDDSVVWENSPTILL